MKLLALVLLVGGGLSSFAFAQKMVSARAGMVYYAEGTLAIDGKMVRAASRGRRPQLEDGQTISSPRGHAEVLIGPNAVLWTGTRAQIRFDDTRVEDTNISVLVGSAIIEVKRALVGSRLQVHIGALTAELTRDGLYRFEATPATVRVYAGEALLSGGARVGKGQGVVDGKVQSLDRKNVDEFHYWSAYRSFLLEGESGTYRKWGGSRLLEREHSGFGVIFPEIPGAARIKALTAGEAGLIYYLEGSALISGQTRATSTRLPLLLGRDNFLRTEVAKAEIFLGVGVVAYLGENSRFNVVDALPSNPLVALDEGSVLIEVAETADGSRPRVRVGESVTELVRPGLYQFDARVGSLKIYGGESSTVLASATMDGKEAQMVNLRDPIPATKFDVTEKDALYKWASDQSFTLFMSPALFMTQWEPTARRNHYKHKQFGEREDSRPRPRLRPRP